MIQDDPGLHNRLRAYAYRKRHHMGRTYYADPGVVLDHGRGYVRHSMCLVHWHKPASSRVEPSCQLVSSKSGSLNVFRLNASVARRAGWPARVAYLRSVSSGFEPLRASDQSRSYATSIDLIVESPLVEAVAPAGG